MTMQSRKLRWHYGERRLYRYATGRKYNYYIQPWSRKTRSGYRLAVRVNGDQDKWRPSATLHSKLTGALAEADSIEERSN